MRLRQQPRRVPGNAQVGPTSRMQRTDYVQTMPLMALRKRESEQMAEMSKRSHERQWASPNFRRSADEPGLSNWEWEKKRCCSGKILRILFKYKKRQHGQNNINTMCLRGWILLLKACLASSSSFEIASSFEIVISMRTQSSDPNKLVLIIATVP